MKLRKEKILYDIAIGTGLYLLDSLRDRLVEGVGSARESASDLYDTASDRASRAAAVIRGEDHPGFNKAAAILLGIGIGAGIGMLLAPASGEETRNTIAEKFRERSGSRERSTGTFGS